MTSFDNAIEGREALKKQAAGMRQEHEAMQQEAAKMKQEKQRLSAQQQVRGESAESACSSILTPFLASRPVFTASASERC